MTKLVHEAANTAASFQQKLNGAIAANPDMTLADIKYNANVDTLMCNGVQQTRFI